MESLRKGPSLSCLYAIYSYNPQRCREYSQNGLKSEDSIDLEDVSPAPSCSFGILPDVNSDEEGVGNRMWCLSLVCGNLEPDLEVDLRPFVAKRIGRGLLGIGSTPVSPMDFKLPSESGRVVPLAHSFCTMLSPGPKSKAVNNDDDLKLIICLLCSSPHLLRAYNLELLQFCQRVASEINAESTEIPKETKAKMASWDTQTHYISNCLSLLGQENTSLLLQAILENRILEISSDDADLETSLRQLWETFNIAKIVGAHDDQQTTKFSLVVKKDDINIFGFDRSASNFAAEWARVLHHHVSDHVKLKDHFDAFNGKIVQILNNLKRMVKAGDASYHALFRSSLFLRWTGAPVTFLKHVRDQTDAADAEMIEVIDVLREFLIEEGFRD